MSNRIDENCTKSKLVSTGIVTGSASIGFFVGGPIGAGIGAIVGGIAVIIKNFAESD